MPNMFEEPIPDPWHQDVCPKMARLSAQGTPEAQALHENLELDGRVPMDRRHKFFQHIRTQSPGASADEGMVLALQSFKRAPVSSAAGLIDETNLVFQSGSPTAPLLSERTKLVSVQEIFPDWKRKLRDWIKNDPLASVDLDEGISTWLRRGLNQSGQLPNDIQRSIVGSFQNYLRDQQRLNEAVTAHPPDRLSWVGLWSEFSRHINHGLERWLEMYGMGEKIYGSSEQTDARPEFRMPAEDRWFVVLRYTVADTPFMLRPTILEAGNPWHYPFPASHCPQKGGKSIVFGEALRAGVAPKTEFVHKSIIFAPENVWAVAVLEGDRPPMNPDGNQALEFARGRHRSWVQAQVR